MIMVYQFNSWLTVHYKKITTALNNIKNNIKKLIQYIFKMTQQKKLTKGKIIIREVMQTYIFN